MYFYRREENGKKVFYGPFLLPKSLLLQHAAEGDFLSDYDREYLESTDQVCVFERPQNLNIDSQVRHRAAVCRLEYLRLFDYFKANVDLDEWCKMVTITKNQHYNISSGRSPVNSLLTRSLINLIAIDSYIFEATGLAIRHMEINGKPICEMDSQEFGENAWEILSALRNSRDLTLHYYWTYKTHLDVGKVFVYVQTHDTRWKACPKQSEMYHNRNKTPEHFAYRAKQTQEQVNLEIKEAVAVTLMEMSRHTTLSDEQRLATKALLAQALEVMKVSGGKHELNNSMEIWNKLLDRNSEFDEMDYFDHYLDANLPVEEGGEPLTWASYPHVKD